jgi:hypothetical protein
MTSKEQEAVMKLRGSRRVVRRLGLALAVAAAFAPSAQASVMAGEASGGPLVKATSYADDLHSAVPRSPVVVEHRNYAPIDPRGRLDLVPSKPRHYAPINPLARPDLQPETSSNVATASSSFDWSDAGIGAGLTFVLVGFGVAILATRHTRRGRLSAV